jgi:hypothetical protein
MNLILGLWDFGLTEWLAVGAVVAWAGVLSVASIFRKRRKK